MSSETVELWNTLKSYLITRIATTYVDFKHPSGTCGEVLAKMRELEDEIDYIECSNCVYDEVAPNEHPCYKCRVTERDSYFVMKDDNDG